METRGTLTPDIFPSSLAHCPVQLTTVSQSISPVSVCTAATLDAPNFLDSSRRIPVTVVSSRIFTPCILAPLASA